MDSKTRFLITKEIDRILALYADTEDHMQLDKQLEKLRALLLKEENDKIKRLLDKGPELTPNEIQWLLDREVLKKDIRKATQLGEVALNKILDNHGIDHKTHDRSKYTAEQIKKVKHLLATTDLDIAQISKRVGVKKHVIYYYKNKETDEMDVKQDIVNLKAEKYEAEKKVEELNKELEVQHKERHHLEHRVKQLKDKLDNNQGIIAELNDLVKETEEKLRIANECHNRLLQYVFFAYQNQMENE